MYIGSETKMKTQKPKTERKARIENQNISYNKNIAYANGSIRITNKCPTINAKGNYSFFSGFEPLVIRIENEPQYRNLYGVVILKEANETTKNLSRVAVVENAEVSFKNGSLVIKSDILKGSDLDAGKTIFTTGWQNIKASFLGESVAVCFKLTCAKKGFQYKPEEKRILWHKEKTNEWKAQTEILQQAEHNKKVLAELKNVRTQQKRISESAIKKAIQTKIKRLEKKVKTAKKQQTKKATTKRRYTKRNIEVTTKPTQKKFLGLFRLPTYEKRK